MPVIAQPLPGQRGISRANGMQKERAVSGGAFAYLTHWSLVPTLLWLGMWANLNTGFWNIFDVNVGWSAIIHPHDASEWQLLLRAIVPFLALPGCLILLCASKARLPLARWSPNVLLLVYGCVATVATVYSPRPEYSIYWSVTFLAAILCTWCLVKRDPCSPSARNTIEATWIICFAGLLALAYLGRESLFTNSGNDMAYSIHEELHELSRASGVGRWAAIPGLVFLYRAFSPGRAPVRLAYLAGSALCVFVVYRVQSRGALFGMLGALAFSLLINRKFQRQFAMALLWVVIGAGMLGNFVSDSGIGHVGRSFNTYVHRGQSSEEFRSMTGRTSAYEHGVAVFQESPWVGSGQWTDRLNPKIGAHIHNSFLQSLLNGGIMGFLPYVASWIAGWAIFFKLWKNSRLLLPADQRKLAEVGMVMAFFLLRAIPETTTASFSVDLMVMVAIYAYLDTLSYLVLRPGTMTGKRTPACDRTRAA